MSTKSIVSNQFRIYTAQKFIEGLFETQLSSNNLFLWIGKVTPWSNESNPDQPHDTDSARAGSFVDMLAVKKVAPSDVSLVIPRHDWTSGTVYSQYAYNGAPASSINYDQYEPATAVNPFYVLTSDDNVYKCIGNNSGAVSSTMPTGKSTGITTTADGYQWKFMFSLSNTEKQKFLTEDWIPVHSVTFNDGSDQYVVQQTAVETLTSPPGGHGSNAVLELGAMYVLVSIKFQYDEAGKVTVDNDFRKFGLIVNPLKYDGTSLFTSLVGTLTTNITLSGVVGTYAPDDTVHGQTSGATGIVVDCVGGVLRLSNVSGTFVTSEIILDQTSGATGGVTAITKPDIRAKSGQMLYTEHAQARTRSADQLENFQIALAF